MKKKVLALLLASAMAFGVLAGCSSNEGGENSGAPETTSSAEEHTLKILPTDYPEEQIAAAVQKGNTELLDQINNAFAELEEDGTLDAIINYYILEEGDAPNFQIDVAEDAPELVMATSADYPPYEYYENDQIVGIDADIARAVADKLGMRLRIDDMDFNSIVAAIQTGKADVAMASMTASPDRAESVDFTNVYMVALNNIVVSVDSPITSIEDLRAEGATYMVGVQTSTTGDTEATADFGEDRIVRYNKTGELIMALKQGKVDCVIIDDRPAQAFVAES